MNSRFIAVGVILALMSTPAAAAKPKRTVTECQPAIDLVDANLTTAAPVTSEQFAVAQALRVRGGELCAAGDVVGGLALLEKAKAILGIQ